METKTGIYDEVLARVEVWLDEQRRRKERADREAAELRDVLLGASWDEGMALARTPRFRRRDLADLLLQESRDAQPDDLETSERLARLAGAMELAPARSAALAGNVRRLRGDLAGAEAALQEASRHLASQPDPLEEAFRDHQLGLLRRDQGEAGEAAALLWRAALLYSDAADLFEEGACLLDLGLLSLDAGRPRKAVFPLFRAARLLETQRDVLPLVQAWLGLALVHALEGSGDRVREALRQARPWYAGIGGAELRALAAWTEGKILALAGRPEEAARLLEMARRGLHPHPLTTPWGASRPGTRRGALARTG